MSRSFFPKSRKLGRFVHCKEVCNMPFNDLNFLINTMVTWDKKDGINGVKYYSFENVTLKKYMYWRSLALVT